MTVFVLQIMIKDTTTGNLLGIFGSFDKALDAAKIVANMEEWKMAAYHNQIRITETEVKGTEE